MPDVIYEVSITIAPERVDEFDAWLPGHIDEILALPGFIDAHTFRGRRDNGELFRCVHYRLRDQESLRRYIEDHAPRMRAQGVALFGDAMHAERRVLTEHERRSTQRCLNCQAVLQGQYCTACGQRHRERMISVWELLRDAFEDLLSWDSRMWRSLRPLLLRPGRLSNEYLSGRRTYYTPPMRMYLVLSIAFFVLSAIPSCNELNADTLLAVDEDDTKVTLDIDGVIVEGGGEAGGETDTAPQTPEQKCELSDLDVDIPGVDPALLRKKVRAICLGMQTPAGRGRLIDDFVDMIPTLLIVMLPLIALVSRVLYPFKRRYYVEHLLFYTHYQSFVFFLLIVLMGVDALLRALGPFDTVATLIKVAATLYAVYYLYRALRVVFRQGRFLTVAKMAVVSLAYFFGAALLAGVGLLIAAWSIG